VCGRRGCRTGGGDGDAMWRIARTRDVHESCVGTWRWHTAVPGGTTISKSTNGVPTPPCPHGRRDSVVLYYCIAVDGRRVFFHPNLARTTVVWCSQPLHLHYGLEHHHHHTCCGVGRDAACCRQCRARQLVRLWYHRHCSHRSGGLVRVVSPMNRSILLLKFGARNTAVVLSKLS